MMGVEVWSFFDRSIKTIFVDDGSFTRCRSNGFSCGRRWYGMVWYQQLVPAGTGTILKIDVWYW